MNKSQTNNSKMDSFKKTREINIAKIKKVIAANNKYIISQTTNQSLQIYDIDTYSSTTIKFYSPIITIVFHPKSEQIFLLADANIIKIYEIEEKTCECKEKVIVLGHTKSITMAEFSKSDEKIFATYSCDNTIKIWSLDNPFCICNILLNHIIEGIQIYKEFIFYYDIKENYIIKYNYQSLEIKGKYKCDIKEYILFNDNELCLINSDSLSIIKNFEEKRNLILKETYIQNFILKETYIQIFYDEDIKILFIFYENYVEIINIPSLNTILTLQISGEQKIFYYNALNQLNLCANFILIYRSKIEYYSFYSRLKISGKIGKTKKSIHNILKNAIPSISNIENLQWNANCKEDIKYKKYLDIPEISKQLKFNYDKSLTEKKLEVDKFMEKNKGVKLDYIQIINQLIKDNTNKAVIIEYLKCLQSKGKASILKYNDIEIEILKDEFEKYKTLLDNKDIKDLKKNLNENIFEEKTHSQKQIFMELLKKIISLHIPEVKKNNINNTNDNFNNANNKDKNINNNKNIINNDKNNEIDDFKNYIDEVIKNLQFFNQPIRPENNELYWQRNCYVIYYALTKILDEVEILRLMQDNIKLILNKGIFDKEYIMKDFILLTNIIILIVHPQPEEYLKFNLNLIETKAPNYCYKNEIKNYYKSEIKNEEEKKKKENAYLLKFNNNLYALNDPSSICIKNYIININKEISLEEIETKTYDSIYNYFNELIDFNKMKKFLSKIFTSNVFKEAFNFLYPDYYKFPFKNENDASNFLDKFYHFIPLKILRTAGITEKFSLETYYILKKRIIYISQYLNKNENQLINKILYKGSVVKTSCHEINHNFYNIFLMHSNGMIPLKTPRKQHIKEREGGRNMEILLFNQKIYKLSIKECLYLLNEKNYQKNLKDFRNGFNELNYEDLKFDDNNIFSELKDVFTIKNFSEIGIKSNITCDDNDESNFLQDTYIEDIEDINDVLGFIRDY